jgi:hypothetical protein
MVMTGAPEKVHTMERIGRCMDGVRVERFDIGTGHRGVYEYGTS